MALRDVLNFAESKGVPAKLDLETLLVDLISSRPGVLAEAIDAYSDLRDVTAEVLHTQFISVLKNGETTQTTTPFVMITVHVETLSNGGRRLVKIPLPLIRAVSVLLSLWKDQFNEENSEISTYVKNFVSSILRDEVDKEGGGASMDEELAEIVSFVAFEKDKVYRALTHTRILLASG